MTHTRPLAAMTFAMALLAVPAAAQQAGAPTPAPASGNPGLVPASGNPNLAVASVKLESGTRVGKIIGMSVYTDGNEKIGAVDDVILTEGDKATVAIVSIGGIMGLGSKLVAMPFNDLKRDADKVVISGVTKDSLNAMPAFVY